MKKIITCFSVIMVCFYFSLSFAQESKPAQTSVEEIVNNVVRPYFAALKNGDINTMKALMAKDMYEQRKVLLEQNKEYPNFLRRLYQDADFVILSANEEGRYILVNAVIEYPDGRKNQSKLYVINENNQPETQTSYGNWKISNKPGL